MSPGSYPEADGQNYMGNQREEVASFVSHMSRGRGGAWARFCSSLLGRCPPEPHCSPGFSVLGLEGPQNQAVGGQGRIGVRRVYIGPRYWPLSAAKAEEAKGEGGHFTSSVSLDMGGGDLLPLLIL